MRTWRLGFTRLVRAPSSRGTRRVAAKPANAAKAPERGRATLASLAALAGRAGRSLRGWIVRLKRRTAWLRGHDDMAPGASAGGGAASGRTDTDDHPGPMNGLSRGLRLLGLARDRPPKRDRPGVPGNAAILGPTTPTSVVPALPLYMLGGEVASLGTAQARLVARPSHFS